MMYLCENNRLESWQIQIGGNETFHFTWLHKVHNITRVMLQHKFFEIETNTQNF